LEQSQQQAEEMKAQEEEMRQNMEELLATQEEMARKEKEMAWTMDAISGLTMLVEYDFRGIITSVNSKICKVTGYLKEELLGQHHSILVDSKNQANTEAYQRMWNDLKNGKPFEGIYTRIAKGGLPFTVKGLCYPIFDEDGQPLKIVELAVEVTDIFEKKQ
jgi:PAS domain S-box-containing protein